MASLVFTMVWGLVLYTEATFHASFCLMDNIKELRCSYFSIPHSFCPAMFNASVDSSITINTAKPFMDVPHLFCHCNRELYHSTLFVMTNLVDSIVKSCVGNLCEFVRSMRYVQTCTAWNNNSLALLLAEKKNCGALLFGQPLYICTFHGSLCHNNSRMWNKS